MNTHIYIYIERERERLDVICPGTPEVRPAPVRARRRRVRRAARGGVERGANHNDNSNNTNHTQYSLLRYATNYDIIYTMRLLLKMNIMMMIIK